MIYIREQIVKNQLYNGEITDEDNIINLLERLMKSTEYLELSFLNEKTHLMSNHDKIRITNLDKDQKSIDIRVFSKGATFVYKKLSISSIQKIVLCTSKTNIVNSHCSDDDISFLDI